jgi:hypothetical protein
MWLRVFGATDDAPDQAAVAASLAGASSSFDGDEGGWYRAEIVHGAGPPVTMERYHADEEGIRAELNSWAAYLETLDYSPHHVALMERTIQSRQLITIRKPADHGDEAGIDRLCAALARRLAEMTNGFYQIDGKGFFDAEGQLLVAEH